MNILTLLLGADCVASAWYLGFRRRRKKQLQTKVYSGFQDNEREDGKAMLARMTMQELRDFSKLMDLVAKKQVPTGRAFLARINEMGTKYNLFS